MTALAWQQRPGAAAIGVVAHHVIASTYAVPGANRTTEHIGFDVVEYVDGTAALIDWRRGSMKPVRTSHRSVTEAKIEAADRWHRGIG